MNRKSIYSIFVIILAFCASCIEDGFTTSPSSQPNFSVDTLDIGLVYTDELTETSRFIVYNRNNKGLNISNIQVSGENASLFRLNVDGMSGKTFQNVEVRANDSIFVFVEAQLPENGQDHPRTINATVDFLVNGVTSSVVLAITGQDLNRLNGTVLTRPTRFTAGKPYRVVDSLVVEEGVTLTLDPGTRIYCHDKSKIIVKGRLVSKGTAENPVIITGDRTGEVIPDVSFDLMSRQWDCIDFWETSYNNYMEYTEVSNTSYGVAVYGFGDDLDRAKLTLVNCKLRNSGECVLVAYNASIYAVGCEFAEASYGLVYLVGGNHKFDRCTAANNYLFSAVENASWMFVDPANYEEFSHFAPTKALITNTITYGYGAEMSPLDITDYEIYFKRCLFKSEGTDDDNFIECLWNQDPLFYTVRNEYLFDYRVKPESPVIEAADPSLYWMQLDADYYGAKRANEIGAYAFVEREENEDTPLK